MGGKLSDRDKEQIVAMLCSGMSQAEVARRFGVSQTTVSYVKRKAGDGVEKTFAGDKEHGTLRKDSSGVFVGTCRMGNGKMKSRRFRGMTLSDATAKWNEWCAWLRAEEESGLRNADVVEAAESVVREYEAQTPAVIEASEPASAPQEPVMDVMGLPPEPQPLYVLVLGSPKVAGYFTDMEQALRIESVMNQALEFAGVDGRYQIVEVAQWEES